jgi:hypothetical protein
MQWRWSKSEPTLDELLSDEPMLQAVRSAGLEPAEFRRRLVALSQRLAVQRRTECCCPT